MTAIAYKSCVLAADSLVTEGDLNFANSDKVRVLDTKYGVWLIAEAGNCCDATVIADEVEDFILQNASGPGGGRGDPLREEEFLRRASRQFKALKTTGQCSVLVVHPSGKSTTFGKEGLDGHWGADVPIAIGVAMWFVHGAMAAGASPARAVELATEKYVSCGGPVKVYEAGKGLVSFPPPHIKLVDCHFVPAGTGVVLSG